MLRRASRTVRKAAVATTGTQARPPLHGASVLLRNLRSEQRSGVKHLDASTAGAPAFQQGRHLASIPAPLLPAFERSAAKSAKGGLLARFLPEDLKKKLRKQHEAKAESAKAEAKKEEGEKRKKKMLETPPAERRRPAIPWLRLTGLIANAKPGGSLPQGGKDNIISFEGSAGSLKQAFWRARVAHQRERAYWAEYWKLQEDGAREDGDEDKKSEPKQLSRPEKRELLMEEARRTLLSRVVCIGINSPGGSPVQSFQINRYIRRLTREFSQKLLPSQVASVRRNVKSGAEKARKQKQANKGMERVMSMLGGGGAGDGGDGNGDGPDDPATADEDAWLKADEDAPNKAPLVFVFAEDVAASGGYAILCAGTPGCVFAHPASLVGSIGVVTSNFGVVDLMAKLGVEDRTMHAGKSKIKGSPFRPLDPAEKQKIEKLLSDLHEKFIQLVKESRGFDQADNLLTTQQEEELFNADVFHGDKAAELKLVDGVCELESEGIVKVLQGILEKEFAELVKKHELSTNADAGAEADSKSTSEENTTASPPLDERHFELEQLSRPKSVLAALFGPGGEGPPSVAMESMMKSSFGGFDAQQCSAAASVAATETILREVREEAAFAQYGSDLRSR